MDEVKERFEGLRAFYRSGMTREVNFRIEALQRLAASIRRHEEEIAEALHRDLRKSPQEAYISETGIVLSEIRMQVRNLRRWARPQKVGTPLFLFPSRSRVLWEPKGVVLIMSPWNYPLQLALDPLVGALAAGNCVALRPSSTSSATSAIIGKIVAEVFPPDHVSVFDGSHEQADELLHQRFDHIFFTGGSDFGRTVMRRAAENLVPVTLELGGKSPCIVDRGANVQVAARRIVWGKLMNAGQTCIAPDYLFVHASLKEKLVSNIAGTIEKFYGSDLRHSPGYPRIISDKAFERLSGYLEGPGDIILGGGTDPEDRFIEPTLIDNADPLSPVMQDEIFGPILPMMTFEDITTVTDFINDREKPLALYYFGSREGASRVLSTTTSGGACVNDTIVHVSNGHLPFGGVGLSGMGRYHGRYSFETFSNPRAVVLSRNRPDIPMRYPPYKRMRLLKKLL